MDANVCKILNGILSLESSSFVVIPSKIHYLLQSLSTHAQNYHKDIKIRGGGVSLPFFFAFDLSFDWVPMRVTLHLASVSFYGQRRKEKDS